MGSGHLLEMRLRMKASPSLFSGSSNSMASWPCCAGAAGSSRTSGSGSFAKYNCLGSAVPCSSISLSTRFCFLSSLQEKYCSSNLLKLVLNLLP